jgi:hypothetical protein
MEAMGKALWLVAAVAAALMQSRGVAAQAGAGSGLEVVVVDAATGRALVGARVRIPRGAAGMTDTAGTAKLVIVDPAGVTVEVTALGYAGRSLTLDVAPGQVFQLTVPLELEPVLLPGVQVGGREGGLPRSREVQDFYRRVRIGTGQYITRTDIERRHVRDLDDLFRALPGFALLTTPAGNKPVLDSKSTASAELFEAEADCPIQYFLDGSPMTPIHDGVLSAEVRLEEIEGIEIYRRGSMVPAKFHRLNNSCGVILIWKRQRTPLIGSAPAR